MADTTICSYGCSSIDGCSGRCEEPSGTCCYGGHKPKSACASCSAWKPLTKEQNVLELAKYYGLIHYGMLDISDTGAGELQCFADALTKPLEEANRQLRTIIDEENKDHIEQQEKLEERIAELERVYAYECEIRNRRGEMLLEANAKIAEQQKLIDHWMIMTNTYADNLELHKAKIAELEARIAEQQKELDSANSQEPVAWCVRYDDLNLKVGIHSSPTMSKDCALATIDCAGEKLTLVPLYTKPFSTKELADCKDAVVKLRKFIMTHWYKDAEYDAIISATSAIVEGYKK